MYGRMEQATFNLDELDHKHQVLTMVQATKHKKQSKRKVILPDGVIGLIAI
jgi:hypothetical protein